MQVQLIPILNNSLVKKEADNANFTECYTVTFNSNKTLSLDETVCDCFQVFTKGWVDALFRLRNWLVIPFKLKSPPDNRPFMEERPKISKGGKVAFFDVKEINANEVLMFADDAHLNAYFSIAIFENGNKKTIQASTIVNIKNNVGTMYFAVVKPFHKIIIKTMMKKIAKQLS
ncbi:MAG: DUF2867 domain-containing protein [Salinivirgaceae bacterium]|jgi:hypothetical protein|nr:DUF2867 domain-containing protein [Salinivirgaceae bacterium]